MTKPLLASLAVLAVAFAGCGGSGGGAAPARTAHDAREALLDTSTQLDRALGTYREGDRGKAADQLRTADREHYASAQGLLRRADPSLATVIETGLRRSVPAQVDRGVEVSALARSLAALEVRIQQGVRALR